MKILIIRLTSMGDVVLATSALSYIYNAHPGAQVTFVTDPAWAPLFMGDARIANLITFNKKQPVADCAVHISGAWDRIIDLQNNRWSHLLIQSANVSGPVVTFNKLHLQRTLLLSTRVSWYHARSTVAHRYCVAAGMPDSTEAQVPDISLSIPEGEKEAAFKKMNLTDSSRFLVLAPFGAWKNKVWPLDRYLEVAREFGLHGWDVAIVGGPEDALAAEVFTRDSLRNVRVCAGKLSLRETAALLKGAALMLGNDTGLSHVARACGVPTGMIFGATTHHWGFFPYGMPPWRVFEAKVWCRPCHAHGGNFCIRGNRPCLLQVTTTEVVAGLRELFTTSQNLP